MGCLTECKNHEYFQGRCAINQFDGRMFRVRIRKAADMETKTPSELLSPLVSYLCCGPMKVEVPTCKASVQLSVTLKISGGRSLYPQVTACGWSGSSLPPCNPTHWAPARPYGYQALLNMFFFRVRRSVAVVSMNLLVASSCRFPVQRGNKERNHLSVNQLTLWWLRLP